MEEGAAITADQEINESHHCAAAAAYVELALFAISTADSVPNLRRWWEDERDSRQKYCLSPAQEDEIVAACKAKRLELEADQKPRKAS